MSFEAFFKKNPIFHYRDLVAYLQSLGKVNQNTVRAALQYHLVKKHIARVRRGYYLVTNDYMPGIDVESDYLLIAGRMTNDSIICYHSAMEFHSLAYSVYSLIYFSSNEHVGYLSCDYGNYQQINHPVKLKPDNIFLEAKPYDRSGMSIYVTTIERTLVDCLHRPELSGGWEEVWRSFESIQFLDIGRIENYAIKLGNATTIAKVGFFLEEHREQFSVTEKQLIKLAQYKPKSRHYMKKPYKGEIKNLQRWNLIVPLYIINKDWEEPSDDSF